MQSRDNDEQEAAWGKLSDQVKRVLRQFGSEDYLGRADYLVVDDNYGFRRVQVEVHKLHMLRPVVVKGLQDLLEEMRSWEIIVTVDIPGTEQTWPRMGLTIRAHEIIDGLQREYFPKEFQSFTYEGSRPGTGFD